MNIVIDTNVVISGTFFGGAPRRVLEAAVAGKVTACATSDIVNEYTGIVREMIQRKQGRLSEDVLSPFIRCLRLVEPVTSVTLSRDPDDDKFIECAVDAKALFIVSGDKDLLVLEQYEGIEIITAAAFCNRYLGMGSTQ